MVSFPRICQSLSDAVVRCEQWKDNLKFEFEFLHTTFIDVCIIAYRGEPLRTFKGCRMGRSDKVSLLYVSLLINTRFRFFVLE